MLLRKKVFKVQEQADPMCHKMTWWGRRLVWPNGEFLLSVQRKREFMPGGRRDKQGDKQAAGICREKIRKAIAQHELTMATVVKDSKKCF